MTPQNNYSEIDKRFDEGRLKQACHCEDCVKLLKDFIHKEISEARKDERRKVTKEIREAIDSLRLSLLDMNTEHNKTKDILISMSNDVAKSILEILSKIEDKPKEKSKEE